MPTPTLSVSPQQQTEIYSQHGETSSPEQGAVLGNRSTPTEGRRWKLEWTMIGSTDLASIDATHQATLGGALTMNYTPPGESTTYRVRFLSGKAGYNRKRLADGLFQVNAEIVEAVEHQ